MGAGNVLLRNEAVILQLAVFWGWEGETAGEGLQFPSTFWKAVFFS